MDDCKPIKTPMPTNGHLDLDEGGKSVDQTLYHSMIGSLLYLTASRPDIMFRVCMCARFQANPKESHISAVKRILRYLKHTPSISLWYPKGASFTLLGYSDSDFAGCRVDRKSTSGGCLKRPLIREDLNVIPTSVPGGWWHIYYIRWFITIQLYAVMGSEAPLSRGLQLKPTQLH